ncbi:MAG: hypothetical protein UX85_C0011G0005 [Candidatus Beckwithbacteria bacterium GW2011_GWB1_47_15]|uniref:Uncharacterized protein n=1 Tax=Candidatus Beckwithbacteria bacterium GW2011_GWB1_47_15 TaxID=1618371 RepID=A0A0G1URT6_9BACT|nr:MAG: hypothetical protein UX50_C0014G0005 [Candidatus Beckwithbacteria bacterium GW2011_GWA1_46_30]KKU60430.1 MAG: hypothetical protein UX85_C0011G0005 [Candidatus Beckwithbacteria bacterium GW2011_GWB1_47_15]KKU71613.1 MAG: hypothetical protein UX97_C0005G0096 [Candidatus Beckwithbacteria bacterium GW2011_GWA2_47_25]OGD48191.1 MAG: hypothetical protein A2877_02875 [Candidatus Beckwithbacteria bacterium RIFCSPHIGHO2_01_FULL_49_39]OGD50188.1 MAG: hypothetical protein A3K56_00630 [Candidatus B
MRENLTGVASEEPPKKPPTARELLSRVLPIFGRSGGSLKFEPKATDLSRVRPKRSQPVEEKPAEK